MTVLRRLALPFLLVFPVLTGCAAGREEIDASFTSGGRSGSSFNAAGVHTQGSSGLDRYLAVRAKRRATSGLAFARLPLDLWPTFRTEALIGVLDPARIEATEGARGAMELDARLSNPLRFYGIGVQRTGGGLSVFAYTHLSQTPAGSEFYPGAAEVEVAIECNGITLSFYSREPGGSWDILAAMAFLESSPLLPALGASSLGANAEFGFDNFRVVQNGTSPDALRPEQELSRQIWLAAEPTLEASYELDGASPDFGDGGSEIDDATALLQTAIATAAATDLGDKKANKKTASALGKALKSLGKADGHAAQGNADKALKELFKALDSLATAGVLVYPETAPP